MRCLGKVPGAYYLSTQLTRKHQTPIEKYVSLQCLYYIKYFEMLHIEIKFYVGNYNEFIKLPDSQFQKFQKEIIFNID